jgi:hypothetical protein
MGPWAVIGLTEALFFHAEVDFVRVSPVGATLPYWGLVNYEKLGYEVYKGVIPFLTLENQWSDLRYKRTSGEAYSVGIQFLPRPHIEITAQYQLQKVYQGPSAGSFGEYGILMFHYYL